MLKPPPLDPARHQDSAIAHLTFASGITSLEPLEGLTGLRSLDLTRAYGITSLKPLKGLIALQSLNLTRAYGIANLEPLKGLKGLKIEGASDKLMATPGC